MSGRIFATVIILVAGVVVAFAQPSTTPGEILAKVLETQKNLARLEAEIAGLSTQLLSETQKLKSWSASNVEGRVIEWPMIAADVDMGIFAHDVVARTETPGIEVRCQFVAGDDTKNLKSLFPAGKEFVCEGRIDSISPRPDKTVITLRQSRAIGDQRKANSKRVSAEVQRPLVSAIENFFGPRYKVDRQQSTAHVIGRRDQIVSAEAEVNRIAVDLDRFGKWLQTPEGRAVTESTITLTVEAPTQDKYGNATGHAKLFTLSISTDEIRRSTTSEWQDLRSTLLA